MPSVLSLTVDMRMPTLMRGCVGQGCLCFASLQTSQFSNFACPPCNVLFPRQTTLTPNHTSLFFTSYSKRFTFIKAYLAMSTHALPWGNGTAADIKQPVGQVQEMQHKGMQPSVPLPSEGTAEHAAPSKQQSNGDESALHKAKISSLNAEVKQLKADKQALLARLTSAEQEEEVEEEEEEGGDKLTKLDTEVAQLKTDRQLLISRVGAVEQMLAEARRATDQKEGHLQGLQVGAVTCPSLTLYQAGVYFFFSHHEERNSPNMASTAVLPRHYVNCLYTCLYILGNLVMIVNCCVTYEWPCRMQKLLEEEERAGRRLQQQLREYHASPPMTQQPSSDDANVAADLQARSHSLLQHRHRGSGMTHSDRVWTWLKLK